MKIGFIGCGRVGTSLAKYFKVKSLDVAGVFDKTTEQAKVSAEFVGTKQFNSIQSLIGECDIIFITVTDCAISIVWQNVLQCGESYLNDKIFIHCSGALSSRIFKTDNPDTTVCSLHPAGAFSDKFESYKSAGSMTFTLEYDSSKNNARIGEVKKLLGTLGNRCTAISADSKAKYHAACVMASNLIVGLMDMAIDTIEECGIESETARVLLGSLAVGNAKNIAAKGTTAALTGPVDRNDAATVQSHLEVLTDEARQIYTRLSKHLVSIARLKYPGRDCSELWRVLDQSRD